MVQPLPLFETAVRHYALALFLLGGAPGVDALAAFPPDPYLSMRNAAFAAGHGGRGPVKTLTQPFRGNGLAPETWSSRPRCAQEGRFTGVAVPEVHLLPARHQERFGGRTPLHFGGAAKARKIRQLSTKLPRMSRSRTIRPNGRIHRIDSPACGGIMASNGSKTGRFRYAESNSGRWFL